MVDRTRNLTVAVLVVAGVVAGGLFKQISMPTVDIRFDSEVPLNVEQHNGTLPNGPELVMVYVGTPSCGFCMRPEMAPLVREAAVNLRERAARDDAKLVSVGLAPHWVPAEGWRFLHRIMNFDEVVVGRNWLNSELVELGWSYPDAEMVTPQIIIYWQEVVPPDEFTRASISRDAPMLRVTGIDEIRGWVEAGSPLEWTSWVFDDSSSDSE